MPRNFAVWLNEWLLTAEPWGLKIDYNRRVQRPEGVVAGAGVDEDTMTQTLLAMALVNMPEYVHFRP